MATFTSFLINSALSAVLVKIVLSLWAPMPLSINVTISSWMCLVGGFALAILSQVIALRLTTKTEDGDGYYGLDHGKLNILLPPGTMWMNMGYWKDTASFPEACEALLNEVLRRSGLISRSGELRDNIKHLAILDLGFGCADQTAALLRLAGSTPLQYTGLTISQTQFRFAQNRFKTDGHNHDGSVQLFCADAAKPDSWGPELRRRVHIVPPSLSNPSDSLSVETEAENWVLALDSLYHFSPSRAPIFAFAAREMQASLMAFDIMQSGDLPWFQRSLLKLAALASGCPLGTFLTEERYCQMLIESGYASQDIEVHDITDYVFGPLTAFMRQRDRDLAAVGLKMGALAIAGKLFGWWARSHIVRGVIVIARRR